MFQELLLFFRAPKIKRNVLFLFLWLLICVLFYRVREILQPFVIALALAYIVDPIVNHIAKRKIKNRAIPRWVAILLIYFVSFLIFWAFMAFFVPQVYKEVANIGRDGQQFISTLNEDKIQSWSEKSQEFIDSAHLPIRIESKPQNSTLQRIKNYISPILGSEDQQMNLEQQQLAKEKEAQNKIFTVNIYELSKDIVKEAGFLLKKQSSDIANKIKSFLGQILGAFFKFFLVLMLTAFMSMSSQSIFTFIFSLIPHEEHERSREFLRRINTGLAGVVRGQFTICLINGLFTLFGLLIFQIKFAFILASFATICSLIPVFGTILSSVPILLVALTSGFSSAIFMVFWIALIHFLEGNFLNPKILGSAAKIHPVLIVLALLTGEHFYGLVGALLAVPVASIMITIFRSFHRKAILLESELSNDLLLDEKLEVE